MSGRRRRSLSPSLFPFLAVLVCTLGTLILLLALVAQNATETAEQNARAQQRMAEAKLQAAQAAPGPPRMTAEAAETKLAEQRFRVAQLVAFRNQQTADLELQRDRLTHLEDHVERLRKELKRLGDEVDHAMGDTAVQAIDDETLAQLRDDINAERTAIEQLRSQSASKTPRVVIVPHKGPNGTDRRPVYLECDPQGVTIWPEGSRITVAQLNDSTPLANPLDAALRAVRFHAMRHYGDSAPPYPLLVVRPDGIETYGAARKAMLDWDDQFGYELVPADVELAFSKPDANLKQRVEIAIREATAKQQALSAIARYSPNGRGTIGQSQDSMTDRSRRRMPILSAATLDRTGRANGFRSSHDDYRAGSPTLGRSPYTSRSPSVTGSPSQTGTGYGHSHSRTMGDSYANMDPSALTRELADQMRTAAREMREQPTSGTEADFKGQGEGSNDRESGQSDLGASSGGLADPTDHRGESHAEAGGPADGESPSASGQPIDSQAETQAALAQGRTQPNALGAANRDPQQSGGSAPMSPQVGSSIGAPAQQQAPATSSQPSMNGSQPRQLVTRQGRDWGLPPRLAGMRGNSIVRSIRVRCYSDRLELLPPSTGGATEVFRFSDGNLDRASLELASAVRDRVDRWGASLPGGRWQPQLDVEVAPGGEDRFHQLQSLMRGSGVDVVGRTLP